MPVRLVPVHDAAAVLRVHLVVDRALHIAAVVDAGRLQAAQDRVELVLADPEAIVDAGKRLAPLVEVDREAIVDVDRRERADARLRPGTPSSSPSRFADATLSRAGTIR